jgi:membrane protease YdiL (CAAX protease family)
MLALFALAIWRPVGPLKRISEVIAQFVAIVFNRSTVLDLAAVSAAAGFGEELLFRGLVQSGIEQASGSTELAILFGAILFGAVHPITPTYAVLAAAIGAYFGWLFAVSGNLLVPILAHAFYDFVALWVYLRIMPARREAEINPLDLPEE